jgi:recombination associated protein RdgC
VAPRGDKHDALAESVGGQLVVKLCAETKRRAGQRGQAAGAGQLDAIEQQTGRRPKGKQVKELKEAVVHALLPRAFPKRSDTLVWIDRPGRHGVGGHRQHQAADAWSRG